MQTPHDAINLWGAICGIATAVAQAAGVVMRHRFWATQIAFALVAPFLLIAIEPLLIFFAPETLGGAGSDSTFLAKKLKFVVKLGNSI